MLKILSGPTASELAELNKARQLRQTSTLLERMRASVSAASRVQSSDMEKLQVVRMING